MTLFSFYVYFTIILAFFDSVVLDYLIMSVKYMKFLFGLGVSFSSYMFYIFLDFKNFIYLLMIFKFLTI